MTLIPHIVLTYRFPARAIAWSLLLGGLLLWGPGCGPGSSPSDAAPDVAATADHMEQAEPRDHVPRLVTDPELLTPEQEAALDLPPAQQPLEALPDPQETPPMDTDPSPRDLMAEVLAELAREDAATEEDDLLADSGSGELPEEAVDAEAPETADQQPPEADEDSDTEEAEDAEDAPEADAAELADIDAEALVAQLAALLESRDDEVTHLQEELGVLREELRQLGESLDIYLGAIMSDLREENQVLRQEMRRLYAREAEGAPIALTDVPRPYGELLDDILYQEDQDFAGQLEAMARAEAETAAAPPPFRFDVLEEWGRSPEAAQESNISSLKGIIGVVPTGSAREDIEALARELRAEYDNHDNINIEIFDHPAAAQQFSERGATDPHHRIISISKYAASGRDVILYFEGGEPTILEGEGVEETPLDDDALEALLLEES